MAGSAPRLEELEALDDAPCALLRTDADGLVLRANTTFCRWMGVEREAIVGTRRLQDFFTTGGRIFHQTHWLPLLTMQGSVSEVKLEFVGAAKEPVPLVLNAIRHERGGAVVHDIAAYVAHDRDKYEKELLASRRQLQAAMQDVQAAHAQARDRALVAEQMMGVVSHDLRNPLSTISMGAALLMKLEPTHQQRAVLERILRATQRSNRLISDLLDFTQARLGGGLSVRKRIFSMREAVHETVDELTLAFPGRELVYRHEGPAEWFGDPDRITQMVGNLVANAMTYGDTTRPVTVSASIDNDRATVAVHNWGRPIPPELLKSIFEPLSRGDSPGEARSLGLGLYIVSQIAKAHRGEVVVTSSQDEGTMFSAQLAREPG
jgi:sigma-B regulation protein RsbU (phosphoserine phosphatase)